MVRRRTKRKEDPPKELDCYVSLVAIFCEFLTVATHSILYERNVYPAESFLRARKYNFPVHQNRHPAVCKWINDAVRAVEEQMLQAYGIVSKQSNHRHLEEDIVNTIRRDTEMRVRIYVKWTCNRHPDHHDVKATSVIIYSPNYVPLERYVFNTAHFPIVPFRNRFVQFSKLPDIPHTSVFDVVEQFRPIFGRISTLSRRFTALPEDCSFTVGIELRDVLEGERVEPPVDLTSMWCPSVPGLQEETVKTSQYEFEAQEGNLESKDWKEWNEENKAIQEEEGEAAREVEREDDDDLWPSTVSSDQGFQNIQGELREGEKGDKQEVSRLGSGNVDTSSFEADKWWRPDRGKYVGGKRLTPMRNVQAGPFNMEIWIEESPDKLVWEQERENIVGTSVE